MIDYSKIMKKILLNEIYEIPDIFSYLQSLEEILNRFQPKSIKETRNINVAKQHLREIRKSARKLTEENKILQEQLNILEEDKKDK